MTTGPLGQGVANAVGMAMSGRRVHGMLDPDAAPGESLFDHHVYVICSDGDLEEGVSGEASSIAGTQELGNITMIYDRNRISIEGDTDVAFTEDVAKRYEAYGWHVQVVDWTNGGTEYKEDVPGAVRRHHRGPRGHRPAVAHRPRHDHRVAGARRAGHREGPRQRPRRRGGRGDQEDPRLGPGASTFEVPPEVIAHTRTLRERGAAWGAEWDEQYDAWSSANPDAAALLHRLKARTLPDGLADALPAFEASEKGVATRSASGEVINAIAPLMPELWGGSADLAGSNNTTIESAPSFVPSSRTTEEWKADPYQGRVLHFGIREHGMGAIMNGIAADGLTRVFGGTFLTFSDYMRGCGPRRRAQPAAGHLRLDPRLDRPRRGRPDAPADRAPRRAARDARARRRPARRRQRDRGRLAGRSSSAPTGPAALALTRQNVPIFPRGVEDGVTRTPATCTAAATCSSTPRAAPPTSS